MNRSSSSRRLIAKQVKEAIAAAPDAVTDDEDTRYNPNDAKSVAAFWKGAVVTHGGGAAAVSAALAARRPGQRGAGKRPPKVSINIRLSPEVLEAFKSTGEGWQTRVDGALKKWLQEHSPSDA